MASVRCEGEKCSGSIVMTPDNPGCGLFLRHDKRTDHLVEVRPESGGKLCPTKITYNPCKFGEISSTDAMFF